jgi:hypothetical protein
LKKYVFEPFSENNFSVNSSPLCPINLFIP